MRVRVDKLQSAPKKIFFIGRKEKYKDTYKQDKIYITE